MTLDIMKCVLVLKGKEKHPRPISNTNIYENFMKFKFLNLNYNFYQATQKKIKKAILYGKNNKNKYML